MYNKRFLTRCVTMGLLLISSGMSAMNLTHPYETIIFAEHTPFYSMQLIGLGQFSAGKAKGYNEDGCRVNPLRIWNADQDAIKMLEGFDNNTAIGQRRILVNANDDGVRGHFNVCGDFSVNSFALSGRWALPHSFAIAAHFPFYYMKLSNVTWAEQTKDITADDARTKQYLTNEFCKNVFDLSGGLELGGWKRSGFGDMSLFFEWREDFKQDKEVLKNVCVNARAGFGFPTGKVRDEDKIFALPFGNDGALSAVIGAGLDLTMSTFMRMGLDVELTHVFANTRCRRIKTNQDQTELLLLAKTKAMRDFGMSQQFTLYGELYKFWDMISCKVAYQYYKHGDDTLHLYDQMYSDCVANTANSLQEWTTHNMFVQLSYSRLCEDKDECRVHPYASVFAKIPVNGKLSAQTNNIGFVVGIDF